MVRRSLEVFIALGRILGDRMKRLFHCVCVKNKKARETSKGEFRRGFCTHSCFPETWMGAHDPLRNSLFKVSRVDDASGRIEGGRRIEGNRIIGLKEVGFFEM